MGEQRNNTPNLECIKGNAKSKMIFKEIELRKETYKFRTPISYMEIYNENAYDLLREEHAEEEFNKWEKLQIYEAENSSIQIKNLLQVDCTSAKDGINLLNIGNYIRKVSATHMNNVSSRSHCIFTIMVESTDRLTGEVTHSKLNLVDLAGSERYSSKNHKDNLLHETKHINLSLTYLEQVIVALKPVKGKKRKHIPYRNSLMTTILKDSLGGNCLTTLIACFSSDFVNLDETLSTCRFASRCAQLENYVCSSLKLRQKGIFLTMLMSS